MPKIDKGSKVLFQLQKSTQLSLVSLIRKKNTMTKIEIVSIERYIILAGLSVLTIKN